MRIFSTLRRLKKSARCRDATTGSRRDEFEKSAFAGYLLSAPEKRRSGGARRGTAAAGEGEETPDGSIIMKTIILTFDDVTVSQLENAAPLLLKYGFGATFFACRFSDEWRSCHSGHLMSATQIRELYDMGFEIGNHTWNHRLPPGECAREIDRLNEFLADVGIPTPETFAYPGGPYNDEAAAILRNRGCLAARTTEYAAWDVDECDPMRVPAIPIQGSDGKLFRQALELGSGINPVVLVFHGTPDLVNPAVSTPAEVLAGYLATLAEGGWRGVGIAEYLRSR